MDSIELGRLVRWNKSNRSTVASVGGLQSITSAISSSARTGQLKAVATLCDTLSLLALDVNNKRIIVDPAVQGGGCDIYSIVRLCMYQLNQRGNVGGTASVGSASASGKNSKYIAPPTHAGVPPQCLIPLAKLIWNVSSVKSEHELVGTGTRGNDGVPPSLVTLFVAETLWCCDQLRSMDVAANTYTLKERNEWNVIKEARFQLFGALWSLSVDSDQWTDEQANQWLPLLPTVLYLIDDMTSGKNNLAIEGDSVVEKGRRKQQQLCLVLMGLIVHVVDAPLCCQCIVEVLQKQREDGANIFYKLNKRERSTGGSISGESESSNQLGHLSWVALKKLSKFMLFEEEVKMGEKAEEDDDEGEEEKKATTTTTTTTNEAQ
jgi:hypothetical protein